MKFRACHINDALGSPHVSSRSQADKVTSPRRAMRARLGSELCQKLPELLPQGPTQLMGLQQNDLLSYCAC